MGKGATGTQPTRDLSDEIPLPVTQGTLYAALAKLREATPGGLSWMIARVEPDGVVLDHSRQPTLRDISALKGLPINSLNLRGTAVSDLGALVGMPLVHLDLWAAMDAQENLATLPRVPLRWLNVGGGPQETITDLEPLKGLPLEYLNVMVAKGNHKLRDLSPLIGMPLKTLILNYCLAVTDITPLVNMPLTELNLRDCGVRDLSPLQKMSLTRLNLSGCKGIASLSPLKGMPLRELKLTQCMGITDLSPLEGMPLKKLSIHKSGVQALTPVMGIKGLHIEYGDRIEILDASNLPTGGAATAGELPPTPRQPATREGLDSKMAALRKEFESILALAKEQDKELDSDCIRCCRLLAELLGKVRGTKLEQAVADEFALWDELLYQHVCGSNAWEQAPTATPADSANQASGEALAGATRDALDAVLARLRDSNPGNVSWRTARIESDGIVLDLGKQPSLTDISALEGMPLKTLILTRCTKLEDLSPLAGLPLQTLNIGNTGVRGQTPVADCPTLKVFAR